MNPYAVLGVRESATAAEIKKAWRKASKFHPDKEGGDRAKFEEAKLAFDVLSDPERRKRYDTMGRVDTSPISNEKVQIYFDEMIQAVVQGTKIDPSWDNVLDHVMLNLVGSLPPLQEQRFVMERQLERCLQLQRRFKKRNPKEAFDPMQVALAKQEKSIREGLAKNQDATELVDAAKKMLQTYRYEVGPGPEGHFSPGPTRRRSGPPFISAPRP